MADYSSNIQFKVNQFIAGELAEHDTVAFKKSYVDVTGDLVAGLLLAQIVYWHCGRLRVYKEGNLWLAKSYDDWWDEVRITPRRAKRALKLLEKLGFVERKYWRFNGLRTTHIRLLWKNFIPAYDNVLATYAAEVSPVSTKSTDRKVQNVPTEKDETYQPLTDTTTETTNIDHDNTINEKEEKNKILQTLINLGVFDKQAHEIIEKAPIEKVVEVMNKHIDNPGQIVNNLKPYMVRG